MTVSPIGGTMTGHRSGCGHGGLTFSSASEARRFDSAPGHHILGVHSDDPAGFRHHPAEEVVRHWNVRDATAHQTRRSAMRAVLYEAFQQLPEVVTVDDPACPETGVVIEVIALSLIHISEPTRLGM